MRERTTFEHTPERGRLQRRLRPFRPLAIALLVIAAITGGSAAADSPPTLAKACGSTSGLDARSSWLMTRDGVRLSSEAGRGSTAIVLGWDLVDTARFAPNARARILKWIRSRSKPS
jgi:hypothetical protein